MVRDVAMTSKCEEELGGGFFAKATTVYSNALENLGPSSVYSMMRCTSSNMMHASLAL